MLLGPDAQPIILFDASPSVALAESTGDDTPATKFSMLAYRQTEKPAAKGGRANANGFRFRHKSMRAIARSFRGTPFISGHNWSDVRARGGTNIDAWGDAVEGAKDELGIFAAVTLSEEWAIRGLANGTIDRFSIGAAGEGEITCTIHDAPVWTECYCWPGLEVDGALCEWEWESAVGKEISAVNVPAVDGTSILEIQHAAPAHSGEMSRPSVAQLAKFAQLCGRVIPTQPAATVVDLAAGPSGGFPPAPAPITMASQHAPATPARGDLMDRAILCASLGLPATATDADIQAKLTTLKAAEGERDSVRAELDASHVEASIVRICASHTVPDKSVAKLRAAAATSRDAFDAMLSIVEDNAPLRIAAGAAPAMAAGARPVLQSDARAAGAVVAGSEDDAPNALEQHRDNPNLGKFMRWARNEKGQSLTNEQVIEYGPREINVLPNLRELADLTSARGA